MLWYDAFFLKNSINYTKFSKKQFKADKHYLHYTVPNKWKFFITKNLNSSPKLSIKLYNNLYFFCIPVPYKINFIKFDVNTNQIIISINYKNVFSITYFNTTKILYSVLCKPLFIKIKFKGKGYYMYKSYRNTITPQFGYSHRLYLYSFTTYVNFLSKSSVFVFGLDPTILKNNTQRVKTWRPINIFTGRGVRFSKQVLYKKSGKVSTYR